MSARVLVIGSGGREHALAWGLARSPQVDDVICAPGNPGMASIGECVAVAPAGISPVARTPTRRSRARGSSPEPA